jgi:methylthioribose-1-phosphate isomerase
VSDPDREPAEDASAEAARSTPDPATAADGADLDRRRFFRQFATELVHTAATVVGAATAIQRSSTEAAGAILNPAGFGESLEAGPAGAASFAPSAAGLGQAATAESDAVPRAVYRSAFRAEHDRLILVNQRRLPEIVEVECRTAIDVANDITERTIVGGPAMGQAAALGLALSAGRVRASRPYARRAILRAAATSLTSAAPWSRQLRSAVERVTDRYVAIGELDEDGNAIADAMQDEANAIVFEANDDHGRLVDAAVARLPGTGFHVLRILTLGSTGTLASGQFGTALAVAQAAHYAGRGVHVTILEGRPNLDGARIAAWELQQAGVPHEVVPDATAAAAIQSGRIHVVLVSAAAIARNGDIANDLGTFAVASASARKGVPVFVCAPLAAVDPAAADGSALPMDDRPGNDSPVVDVTPADVITAIATEEGLLEAPFEASLAAALERRAARRSGPAASPASAT